ncbi:hypothetical protein [Nocardia brasiliensis]|uniref:hypothetical protein n=1 Tax=Nocardia brasiliensis TaxID=37326 RepID=UPI002454BCEF|nr:hypothetical protein [Nocardia brasiliensis]
MTGLRFPACTLAIACWSLSLVALAAGWTSVEAVSAALCMPLLAGAVLVYLAPQRPPAALMVAYAALTIADLFPDRIFLPNLVALLCYIAIFVQLGAWAQLQRKPIASFVLLNLIPAGLVTAILTEFGLSALPAACYAVALAVMPALSTQLGHWIMLGAFAFLVHDVFVAFALREATSPPYPFAVRAIHLLAQALIACGLVQVLSKQPVRNRNSSRLRRVRSRW